MLDQFVFADEVEANFIHVLWHEPHRLPYVLAQLDPQVHITQPHLRLILGAIEISIGECGDADWFTVIAILGEQAKLLDCGGLDGLNQIWKADQYIHTPDALFSEYLRLLKEYARSRQDQERVYPFTGGKGTVYPNKNRRSAKDPDFKGASRIAGKHYETAVWVNHHGEFLNFTFKPL